MPPADLAPILSWADYAIDALGRLLTFNAGREFIPKGQVTIPIAIRKKAGLLPNTEVEVDFDGEHVRIRRARRKKKPTRCAIGLNARADVEAMCR